VLVSDRDWTKFGTLTCEASPPIGAKIDETRVDHSPGAAVLTAALVTVYVQAPGHRFPD
jgi:hypothetical protein